MNKETINLIRDQCAKALKASRAYKKVHPEAFTVWQHAERKGAALLARRISRILKSK
ncbi:MAG: hypothetical protein ACK5DE_02100 [Bacteroidota bacterium]